MFYKVDWLVRRSIGNLVSFRPYEDYAARHQALEICCDPGLNRLRGTMDSIDQIDVSGQELLLSELQE